MKHISAMVIAHTLHQTAFKYSITGVLRVDNDHDNTLDYSGGLSIRKGTSIHWIAILVLRPYRY